MTERRLALTRPYVAALGVLLALAAVAASLGLLVPSLYRDGEPLLPQLYGQDLVTLGVAVPALAIGIRLASHGSVRGYVIWLGVVGYLLYTYASYAFMTAFNDLYLVYVALFGLSLFTFVGGLSRVDPRALQGASDDRSVGPYWLFFLLTTVLVGFAWLSDVLSATFRDTVPEAIAGTGVPTPVVQSIDLAVVLPAFVLTAFLLRRGHPWGFALTGIILVKIATLGLAVVAMGRFQARAGDPAPLALEVLFTLVSVAAIWLCVRYLRSLAVTAATSSGVADTIPSSTGDGHS